MLTEAEILEPPVKVRKIIYGPNGPMVRWYSGEIVVANLIRGSRSRHVASGWILSKLETMGFEITPQRLDKIMRRIGYRIVLESSHGKWYSLGYE